ncbi:MAG TPA: molybdopterin-dependent oxidoreductase [Candidatus Sulfotelmatobacter sp.]|nr:molybdopterin-dependent oxidoreductase [Candidatus Sulfotelmatobacter sp.]
MKFSRRDLLIGTAGATAGIVFTPVPWKLLGDVSIWSQNWPWIPQPAHGPIETTLSACTLCAAGCGMRVRMAAGFPVGISGVANHPLTKGALCPLGYAAHQLNWHPARLLQVRHSGRASSWPEAQAALAAACAEGPIAVVDGRPGRAASLTLETFAAKRNGSYQTVLGPETQALAPYAAWSGVPASALGYDLENARTIVSFGAPLLDGWGTPGRFTRLWSARAAGQSDPQLRLIQIEPVLSHTAARAWRWVAVREGTQDALAAALARVLVEEHLVKAQGPLPEMTLEQAAVQAGLPIAEIRDLAHAMVEHGPTVVITSDGDPAVAALNVLLGAIGTPGGISLKSKVSPQHGAASTASAKFRATLLDASVPWDLIPPTQGEVFRFAAWDGGGSKADWLLPSPGFLEELTDIPTAPTSATETYTIATNLLAQPQETQTAAQFLRKIDASLADVDKSIHARCEQIFQVKLGTIYAGQTKPVSQFESAAKMEEQLRKGGVWLGESPRNATLHCTLKTWPATSAPASPTDWTSSWAPPVLPPLASKLYQESTVREAPAGRPA